MSAPPRTAQPDGTCHAVVALRDGCGNPVPDGRWTCDEHAVELWKRGQELIGKHRAQRKTRGMTPSSSATGTGEYTNGARRERQG